MIKCVVELKSRRGRLVILNLPVDCFESNCLARSDFPAQQSLGD